MGSTGWNSKTYVKFNEERAREYADIACNVFAPIFPAIAGQIVERCRIVEGMCIDVGSGPANLAITLAEITDLRLYAMDYSWYIGKIAEENIAGKGMGSRVRSITGDVHRMPFRSNTASLIASRGSMRFWKNKPVAFGELYRVLRPGGRAYVGGGMGSSGLADAVALEMAKRDPNWSTRPKVQTRKRDSKHLADAMRRAGFASYEIIDDDSGFWLYMEK
jgi:ubiquinone/menaquinone biosynthesis C-methylase UbiE